MRVSVLSFQNYFILLLFSFVGGNFLGGTVSWKILRNLCIFTYRTTWEKQTGPCGISCSNSNIGSLTHSTVFANRLWVKEVGSTFVNTTNDMNYYLTSLNDKPSYEQGENTFKMSISNGEMFDIRLPPISWIKTTNDSSTVKVSMRTKVDTSIRNDTGLSNASPVAALSPYIGLQLGCRSEIKIPVIDPDYDMIRCKWAEQNDCGTSCTNMPNAQLDKSSCTVVVNTSTLYGYLPGQVYRVTIVAEDFPKYPVLLNGNKVTSEQALSSIPIQFAVHVVGGSGPCVNSMQFVYPTRQDNDRVSYRDFSIPLEYAVYVETHDYNGTSFMVNSPRGMQIQHLSDDNGRDNVTRLSIKWKTAPGAFIGDFLLCVWVIVSYGISSTCRCLDAIVMDIDECTSSPCKENGTCINLLGRYTCHCKDGYMPPFCSEKTTCEGYCLNNGRCIDSSSQIKCDCNKGFKGERCEEEVNECLAFPCINGGLCEDGIGGFRCLCIGNFTGSICQYDGDVPVYESSNWLGSTEFIVGTSSGVAALTLAGSGLVYIYLRHRKKLTKISASKQKSWASRPGM